MSSGYDLKKSSGCQVSLISPSMESPLVRPLTLNTPFDPGKFTVFVTEALETANRLGLVSKEQGDVERLQEVFVEAFDEHDTRRGVDAALRWAGDFVWTEDLFALDRERFRNNGNSLTQLARDLFFESAPTRMNAERVLASRHRDSDPEHHDWDLLAHMASHGIHIPVADSFCPRIKPRPLRKTYSDVAPAVNKAMVELQRKGSVFLLKLSDIQESVERDEVHFSDMHWVVKIDADKGRPIADVSAGAVGEDTLNSEDIKQRGIEKFGELTHPTVLSFAAMIEGQRSRYRRELENGEKLVLWKSDIDSAFMQMRIAPESVKLVLFPLTDDVVMGYVTGFFGWTSFPQCFDVITRRIRSIAKCSLEGDSIGYVDDFGGACLERDVIRVIDKFCTIVEGLLGPGSVNLKKTIWGRKIVFIGWEFDLDGGPSISLSDRNLRKVLHGIFSIPSDWKLRRSVIERLGSWASRYFSIVFPQLRPFASLLYQEIHGLDRDIWKVLSESCRCVVVIWRAFMCMLIIRPLVFRRQLYQLLPPAPSIYVSFDASLTGLGVRLFGLSDNKIGHCFKVLWVQFDPCLYSFSKSLDSSFQNSTEFLAVTVALAYLVYIGVHDATVRLQGDSVTALTWASTRAFRPGRSFRSACLQMQIALRSNLTVDDTTDHIKGVLNYDNDLISRSGDLGSEASPIDISQLYPVELLVTRHSLRWLDQLLSICNPEAVSESSSDIETFWCSLNRFADFLTHKKTLDHVDSEGCVNEYGSSPEGSNSSLQLFVSAPMSGSPLDATNKRAAWVCLLPMSASVGELLEAVAQEYDVPSENLKLRVARLNLFLVSSNSSKSLVEELGLVNADTVELFAGLKGGMKRVWSESEIQSWSREACISLASSTVSLEPKYAYCSRNLSASETSYEEYSVWAQDSRNLLKRYKRVDLTSPSFGSVAGSNLIKPNDLSNLSRIQGVSSGTNDNYRRAWPWWVEFLDSRNQLHIVFLVDISLSVSRIIVANFIIWLAEVKSKSESQIKTIFSGLRSAFLRAGEDVSIFADPLISYTKRAFAENPRDTSIRRLQGLKGKLRLPACFEFLVVLRDWVRSSPVNDSQSRLMIYLASVTMYNFGLRFCNVGYDSKVKGKHALRRQDVVFEDISDRRFNIPQYYEFLMELGVWHDREAVKLRVTCLVIFFHSSKVRKKVGRVEVLGRRSVHEIQLLEDLAMWILFDSGLGCSSREGNLQDSYKADALVFSRSHCKVYKTKGPTWLNARLLRSEVSGGAKLAAAKLGLDPLYFSSHCFKIAAITDMATEGESVEVIRRLGDHATGSASTFLYQHPSGREMRPLLLASTERGLSVRDVRTICPIREHQISQDSSPEALVSLAEIEDNTFYTPAVITSIADFDNWISESDRLELLA
jgi:hypothetical protein